MVARSCGTAFYRPVARSTTLARAQEAKRDAARETSVSVYAAVSHRSKLSSHTPRRNGIFSRPRAMLPTNEAFSLLASLSSPARRRARARHGGHDCVPPTLRFFEIRSGNGSERGEAREEPSRRACRITDYYDNNGKSETAFSEREMEQGSMHCLLQS